MGEPISPIFENSSEATHGLSSTLNSTSALPTMSLSPVVGVAGMVSMAVGSLANAGVLAVLLRARKHAASSVHTLIANQSAMELVACVSGVITAIMALTYHFKYEGNPIVDGIICVIFEHAALHIQIQHFSYRKIGIFLSNT